MLEARYLPCIPTLAHHTTFLGKLSRGNIVEFDERNALYAIGLVEEQKGKMVKKNSSVMMIETEMRGGGGEAHLLPRY